MKASKMLLYMIREREITGKRALNFFINYLAFVAKRPKAIGPPSILMIEPTNICNLACPICPTGAGTLGTPKGLMAFDEFKRIIDECGSYLLSITLWNWGEPFLNKDLLRMIEYAKAKRIFIRISTNGNWPTNPEKITRLVRSGLDELIFSVDGATAESYAKYRINGNFNTVINNMKAVVEEKRRLGRRTPYVELQFIVMSHNEHEIAKIKDMAKEIGVDHLKLKTVNLEMDYKGQKEVTKGFAPKDKEFSRYTEELARKGVIKNECMRLYLSSVINWDGSVVPCCYDSHRDFEFGNVHAGGFMKVWNNEKYVNMRKAMVHHKQNIPMCKDCPGKLMGLEVS